MDEEYQCLCCYCESKGKPDNEEYIRGIKFAVQYLVDEYAQLYASREVNRKNNQIGTISDKQLRNYNDHIETQMRFLGQWHDILAKEGNKELKLIKDIDWIEHLYGDPQD